MSQVTAALAAPFVVGRPAQQRVVALRQKAILWARKKAPRKYSAADRNKTPVDDYPTLSPEQMPPMFTVLAPGAPLPKKEKHTSWAPAQQ